MKLPEKLLWPNTRKKLHHVFHTRQADGKTMSKRGAVYVDADAGHAIFSHKQTNGKTVKFLVHSLDETPVQTSNWLPRWQRCQLLPADLMNFITPSFSPFFMLNSFHKATGDWLQHGTSLYKAISKRTTSVIKYIQRRSQIHTQTHFGNFPNAEWYQLWPNQVETAAIC